MIDGDHFPHVDLNFKDDPVGLRVIDGIAASFLQVSAEVDAAAEHPVFRRAKTFGLDGFSSLPGGTMVHDVRFITTWLREVPSTYPKGLFKVIYSPLVWYVGVTITVTETRKLRNERKKENTPQYLRSIVSSGCV